MNQHDSMAVVTCHDTNPQYQRKMSGVHSCKIKTSQSYKFSRDIRDATQSPGKSAIFSSLKIAIPPPSPFYL